VAAAAAAREEKATAARAVERPAKAADLAAEWAAAEREEVGRAVEMAVAVTVAADSEAAVELAADCQESGAESSGAVGLVVAS